MKKSISFSILPVVTLSLMLGMSAFASQGSGTVQKFIGDDQFTSNIFDLTTHAGLTGAPANQPWSGTFWPLRAGSTANPYQERFNFKLNILAATKKNIKRFSKRMVMLRDKIMEGKLDADTIRDMAPAEKYDLYLSDYDFSFSSAEWQSVSEQFAFVGQISMWEGSCHGWSTAAINEPRPAHEINVMSLDGKYLIPFYPHDLKALASRLWANSLVQDHTVFEGNRCNNKDPKADPRTGHITDGTCLGVNPGDFHVSVMEMIGNRKTSFVINRSYNTQIWNQPVAGYEMKYFNPITDKTGELAQSVVSSEHYADPFKSFRSPLARSIVGVEMKLKYISETTPNHDKTDTVKDDKVKTLKLRYDLELDANNKVVGGEWRNSSDPEAASADDSSDDGYNDETANIPKRPGFLWKFEAKYPIAYSIGDFDIPGNDVTKADRMTVINASKKAAQFRYNMYDYAADGTAILRRAELKPQPLQKVVGALFDLAK